VPSTPSIERTDHVGAPRPSADEARRRADEILSRAEFQPPEQSWFDRVRDWWDDSVRTFFDSLLSGGAASIVTWFVLVLMLAVVAVLVVRVTRSLQPVPSQPVMLRQDARVSAADWRAEAETHERAKEWKDALRCRYRALVAELIERKVLRDVPGRTAGEFRVELGAHAPRVSTPFAGASELFERAWYGDAPTGAGENQRFRQLADEVLRGSR
jgi:hypothetical protein